MKLKDYYRKAVDMNDSLSGGWATLYYGVFSDVIRENKYKNIAEIGIGYGTHAKFILKNNPDIEQLYLIDPMKFYDDAFAHGIAEQEPEIEGGNLFDEFHTLICQELSPWSSKFTWIRKESAVVTEKDIPNESLDCIFVDGDHSFEHAHHDLHFWWKKLKKGGQMLGDDYWMGDVEKAVRLFSEEINVPYDLLHKNNYAIFRFHKK